MRGDRRKQMFGLIPPAARPLRGAQIARLLSLFVFMTSAFASATGQVGPDAPKRTMPLPPMSTAPNKPPPTKAPPTKAPPSKAPPTKPPPTKAPPTKAPPTKPPPTKPPPTKPPPSKLPPRGIELKGEVLSTLRDSFIRIPAGEFMMGSGNSANDERPVHRVRISRAFEMGKYEVTQAQWEALTGGNPSSFRGPTLPVETVSWNEVQQFIQKLNAQNDGYTYRLPTEAEWEYACRAGSTGDHAGNLDAMAWYSANSDNRTHPVGQKKGNAWGLHDMHGNVWEWCQDWYNGAYYAQSPEIDPQGPASGSDRVFRGGELHSDARGLGLALRNSYSPALRPGVTVGFRLVRTPR